MTEPQEAQRLLAAERADTLERLAGLEREFHGFIESPSTARSRSASVRSMCPDRFG